MRVGLFVTCLVDLIRPRIGFAALKLLEKAGCNVVVPKTQTCCGQPGYNSGEAASARALARKLLHEFAGCDYVVAPSGSCAGMIRVHYPQLFGDADDDERKTMQNLAARTFELSDFLVNVAKVENVGGTFAGALTYHDSCSGLRELGVKSQPRALLARVKGLRIEEMQEPEVCCGFGGTFAVKFPDISTRMADNKCKHIQACGVDGVTLGDLGCILNIEGRLRRTGDVNTRVLHFAEILAGAGTE